MVEVISLKLIYLLIDRLTLFLILLLFGHLRVAFSQLEQSKCFHVFLADVNYSLLLQPVEIIREVLQLLVLCIIIEWQDGHAVVHVEGEGQTAVVYHQYFALVTVRLKDAQVLHITEWCHHAVVTVQSRLKDRAVRVQKVEDCVCIVSLAGCECYNLIKLFQLKEALHQVRSHVYVYNLRSILVLHLDLVLALHGRGVSLIDGVHHSLINIKNQKLFMTLGYLYRLQLFVS